MQAMTTLKRILSKYKPYIFEFLSIFIGVTMAFALDKWNEDRKENRSEIKTLIEIRNGLEADTRDLEDNIKGHKRGIQSCFYFRSLLDNQPVATDSIPIHFIVLFRDFISIQNSSGYESLKSRGLDLIKNDSLRLEIIAIHDFYYEIIEKLEEQYSEMQFHENYFDPINTILAEFLEFDANGRLITIKQPITLSIQDKNRILSYLWKIEYNRQYTLKNYEITLEKVKALIQHIDEELEKRY